MEKKKKKGGIWCEGCAQPILGSAPFYCCAQCNYYLHKCCADLPLELQHPSHPQHPLVLEITESSSFFSCKCCKLLCNGFSFSCKACNFDIDVKCASVPNSVTHEAHKIHPLVYTVKSRDARCRCRACGSYICDFALGCENCSFHIHYRCALFPATVAHRYDEHRLRLIYPPYGDHPEDFICEICERDIHPKHWMYHCWDCDYSFHLSCIPSVDDDSNVKCGGRLEDGRHPHWLTIVRSSIPYCRCNACGRPLHEFLGLDCVACNFKLCWGNCFLKYYSFSPGSSRFVPKNFMSNKVEKQENSDK